MADRKTTGELLKLTTPRLLAYYKAERGRFLKSECNKIFTERKELDPISHVYIDWLNYINIIKFELSSRDHVEK